MHGTGAAAQATIRCASCTIGSNSCPGGMYSARMPWLAMRQGPWKVLVKPDGSGLELYNVVADRSESNDLAASHADIARLMGAALLAWRKTLPTGKP